MLVTTLTLGLRTRMYPSRSTGVEWPAPAASITQHSWHGRIRYMNRMKWYGRLPFAGLLKTRKRLLRTPAVNSFVVVLPQLPVTTTKRLLVSKDERYRPPERSRVALATCLSQGKSTTSDQPNASVFRRDQFVARVVHFSVIVLKDRRKKSGALLAASECGGSQNASHSCKCTVVGTRGCAGRGAGTVRLARHS